MTDIRGLHISFAGPTRHIVVDGVHFTFEMHDYCGPTLLDQRGDPAKSQRPRSPFWEAVSLWSQQGERVGDDNLCIWDPPDREAALNQPSRKGTP